ncbi:MAG: penicillin-binding protein 1B [Methylococcales bacterium]|nr:penicillin-binding protein 1B [Methylococcales bacterium]
MARQPRKTGATPRRRKPVARSGFKYKWLISLLIPVILVAGIGGFSYIGYLDYTVREKFEGKRWSIPARVYASPVELYAGYQLTPASFVDLLMQLHYRQDSQLGGEGSYFVDGPHIKVRTHSFNFADTAEKSHPISVTFEGDSIARIADLDTGNEEAIVRLDPVQIGSFYPTLKEDRILIKLDEAPKALLQGLFSTEDRDFYSHHGLSFKGILRAMWVNVKAGGLVAGGSTITQQLVKNFYLTSERSLARKINEALMAFILEYRYSKNEILEAYLNEIFLGQDGASAIHGFGLASEFYFGEPLKNLSLSQNATLVALVRGPSYYDPRKNPERALERRNLVLDSMQEEGYLTPQQTADAKKEPLSVATVTHRSANRYPDFIDLVKRQLKQEYKEEDLTSEGLRIVTTLDTRIQDTLEKTITEKLQKLEKSPKSNDLESAAIVTRRDSGEIVALAGGRNSASTGFNRALDAVRPIGSLIKPVIYLTALEQPNRYTIVTPVSDTEMEIVGENGKVWSPKNFDNRQHGTVALHTALANSYNMATVRVGMDIGLSHVANTLKSMGVGRPVELYPSFLLGASPLTPLEVTQMYQTLAGDGYATPLRSIRAVNAADGRALQSYPLTVRQAVEPAATFITNTILQEVMRSGTGHSAYNYMPADMALVGKTGTTNQLRDSWFAGFTGDFLSVVWVGRDDNKSTGLTGGGGALQIWADLMRQISKKPVTLTPPDNIEMKWIDPASGELSSEYCPGAHLYPFIENSGPNEYVDCRSLF